MTITDFPHLQVVINKLRRNDKDMTELNLDCMKLGLDLDNSDHDHNVLGDLDHQIDPDDANNNNNNNNARGLGGNNNNNNHNNRRGRNNNTEAEFSSTFHYYVGVLAESMRNNTNVDTVYIGFEFIRNLTAKSGLLLFSAIGNLPNIKHLDIFINRNGLHREFPIRLLTRALFASKHQLQSVGLYNAKLLGSHHDFENFTNTLQKCKQLTKFRCFQVHFPHHGRPQLQSQLTTDTSRRSLFGLDPLLRSLANLNKLEDMRIIHNNSTSTNNQNQMENEDNIINTITGAQEPAVAAIQRRTRRRTRPRRRRRVRAPLLHQENDGDNDNNNERDHDHENNEDHNDNDSVDSGNNSTISFSSLTALDDIFDEDDDDDGIVSDETIETLCSLSNLKRLSLNGLKLGHDKLLGISIALASSESSLEYLNLCCNDIDDYTGGIDVIQALKTNTKLKELHLSYNNLGRDSCKALAGAIMQNPNLPLKILNLSHNTNIGDSGCIEIAKALVPKRILPWIANNSTISSSVVADTYDDNDSDDDDDDDDTIESDNDKNVNHTENTTTACCSNIEKLDFSACNLSGYQSCYYIAHVLKHNTVLKRLYLRHNDDITIEGYQLLLDAIEYNLYLENIFLDYHTINYYYSTNYLKNASTSKPTVTTTATSSPSSSTLLLTSRSSFSGRTSAAGEFNNNITGGANSSSTNRCAPPATNNFASKFNYYLNLNRSGRHKLVRNNYNTMTKEEWVQNIIDIGSSSTSLLSSSSSSIAALSSLPSSYYNTAATSSNTKIKFRTKKTSQKGQRKLNFQNITDFNKLFYWIQAKPFLLEQQQQEHNNDDNGKEENNE